MARPCEYCGADLPDNVDKRSRRARSYHFATCPDRPRLQLDQKSADRDVLDAAISALEADCDWRVRQEAACGLRAMRDRM
jgi:hypothetical protein